MYCRRGELCHEKLYEGGVSLNIIRVLGTNFNPFLFDNDAYTSSSIIMIDSSQEYLLNHLISDIKFIVNISVGCNGMGTVICIASLLITDLHVAVHNMNKCLIQRYRIILCYIASTR